MPSTANRRIAADDAPGDLAIVQSFLNTAQTGKGDGVRPELLTDPGALQAWAGEVGLPTGVVPGESPEDQVGSLRGLRDALRAALAGDRGGPAIDADARLRLAGDGLVRVTQDGSTSLAGQLLGMVLAAQVRGDWPRLKICALEPCGAVYYDRSRNTSSRYHTPWCANVVNLRSSRERKRLADS